MYLKLRLDWHPCFIWQPSPGTLRALGLSRLTPLAFSGPFSFEPVPTWPEPPLLLCLPPCPPSAAAGGRPVQPRRGEAGPAPLCLSLSTAAGACPCRSRGAAESCRRPLRAWSCRAVALGSVEHWEELCSPHTQDSFEIQDSPGGFVQCVFFYWDLAQTLRGGALSLKS